MFNALCETIDTPSVQMHPVNNYSGVYQCFEKQPPPIHTKPLYLRRHIPMIVNSRVIVIRCQDLL